MPHKIPGVFFVQFYQAFKFLPDPADPGIFPEFPSSGLQGAVLTNSLTLSGHFSGQYFNLNLPGACKPIEAFLPYWAFLFVAREFLYGRQQNCPKNQNMKHVDNRKMATRKAK